MFMQIVVRLELWHYFIEIMARSFSRAFFLEKASFLCSYIARLDSRKPDKVINRIKIRAAAKEPIKDPVTRLQKL